MSAPTLLLGRRELARIVERLGAEIAADHPDGVVLVDFMAISRFAPDSGRVRILKDLDLDLTGRDVVLVEDMVDTGLTATYLCGQLRERGPRTLSLCTLLDRPVRRIVPLDVRYRGAEIPDVFVLGYGLHLAELYRNLDQVYEADQQVVRAAPASLVPALYGTGGAA